MIASKPCPPVTNAARRAAGRAQMRLPAGNPPNRTRWLDSAVMICKPSERKGLCAKVFRMLVFWLPPAGEWRFARPLLQILHERDQPAHRSCRDSRPAACRNS